MLATVSNTHVSWKKKARYDESGYMHRRGSILFCKPVGIPSLSSQSAEQAKMDICTGLIYTIIIYNLPDIMVSLLFTYQNGKAPRFSRTAKTEKASAAFQEGGCWVLVLLRCYCPYLRQRTPSEREITSINQSTTLFQQGNPTQLDDWYPEGPCILKIHYIYKDKNVIMDIILLKVKILNW